MEYQLLESVAITTTNPELKKVIEEVIKLAKIAENRFPSKYFCIEKRGIVIPAQEKGELISTKIFSEVRFGLEDPLPIRQAGRAEEIVCDQLNMKLACEASLPDIYYDISKVLALYTLTQEQILSYSRTHQNLDDNEQNFFMKEGGEVFFVKLIDDKEKKKARVAVIHNPFGKQERILEGSYKMRDVSLVVPQIPIRW